MELKHRDIQTRIKHEILKQYLVKWYPIISMGLRGQLFQHPGMRDKFEAHFLYVDYFAYTGVYEDGGVSVDGSPVIGIKALDELRAWFPTQTGGLVPRTSTILFEDKLKVFEGLVATLNGFGWADRLRRVDKNERLGEEDIGLIYGDSSQYVDRVLRYIDNIDPTFSFHFIDPFGAKSVEWHNVERIVSKKGADCIINMMFDPIYRFLKPAENTEEEDSRAGEVDKAEYYDKFFGPVPWRDVARDLEAGAIDHAKAEELLVGGYETALKNADKALGVKRIRLKFSKRDQTYYYLFLTTHDSDGAFAMNEVLSQAEIRQYDYREELRQTKEHAEDVPLSFFADMIDEKRPTDPQPDIDHLARTIYTACKGQTLTYKQVLDVMINSPYFPKDMLAAMGKLREQKRAVFEVAPSALTSKTPIKFA